MDPLSLAAVVVVAALCAYVVRTLTQTAEQERVRAAQERAQIISRVQAPDRIPAPLWTPEPQEHVIPDDEIEMGKVGLVLIGGDGEDDAA